MKAGSISTADCIIIGGGVIGCSVAHALARRMERVVIFERRVPGCEASQAAAGMLSPQVEAVAPGAFLDLCLRSLQLYPEFVQQLQEESSIDVGYETRPALVAALTEDDAVALKQQCKWQEKQGLAVEWLGRNEVRHLEPLLTTAARGGLVLPNEAQVDNVRLVQALVSAARLRGAELVTGLSVEEVLVDEGRVRGIRTRSGEWHAPHVVIAAGSWSNVPGTGMDIPVVPVRGQIVVCEGPAAELKAVLHSPRVYIVPRAGRVLLGSTSEKAGFDARLTAEGVRSIFERAIELMPSLADWTFKEGWGGLRPWLADGLPVLGPTQVQGLHLAAGHFRSGILLAPVTGAMLAASILGVEPPLPLEPFLLSRLQQPAAVPA